MPGYGVRSGTHRIPLKDFDGSDNWVDIRESRSSQAVARVAAAGLQLAGVTADGTPRLGAKVDLAEMRAVLFEEAILAWSLRADEADAQPMPLGRETYANVLQGDVGTWLDGAITRYYAERQLGEEALGNSSGSSSAT